MSNVSGSGKSSAKGKAKFDFEKYVNEARIKIEQNKEILKYAKKNNMSAKDRKKVRNLIFSIKSRLKKMHEVR